jgi:hypothetical protein
MWNKLVNKSLLWTVSPTQEKLAIGIFQPISEVFGEVSEIAMSLSQVAEVTKKQFLFFAKNTSAHYQQLRELLAEKKEASVKEQLEAYFFECYSFGEVVDKED